MDRDDARRAEARDRTRRDVARLSRREPGDGFWRSLTLVGSVGWPIVLFATGGALLGRYLDKVWATDVLFTVVLLVLGTVVGTYVAYRSVRGGRS